MVCSSRRRAKRCGCGVAATLLCDWKMAAGKTCDRPICMGCAQQVADDKHLCPEHRAAYREWLTARRVAK